MISSKGLLAVLTVTSLSVLTGCATPGVSESLYRSSEVGASKKVVRCRVTEVREVLIRDEKEDAETGGIFGAIMGGVIGNTLGSQIGGGLGRDLAGQIGTGAGAAAGAVAGTKMADKLSERKGVEYSVILADGEEITHVQELLPTDRILAMNETCRLQVGVNGKNRVLPAEHLSDEVFAPKQTTIKPLPNQ